MATQTNGTLDELKDTLVVCQTHQGHQIRATTIRLTRHLAIFEVYSPFPLLQLSEVLTEFRILLHERVIYSGRAVVSNLINTGGVVVCEVQLEESWVDFDSITANGTSTLQGKFLEFMRSAQQAFHILPEFKLVVADMQIFLQDVRHWLDQVELGIQAQPSGSRQQLEQQVIADAQQPILPMLGLLFEKFEEVCRRIPPELRPAHRTYVKRQLHPIVLCAPFMYRTFKKPLGYAGDYEMVSMMVRDPREGASVFAKVLNTFFLQTPPVVAHRNRITQLKHVLKSEAMRLLPKHRPIKIFNLGCGPAKEIQEFLEESDLGNQANFTLLDFNEETLQHTQRVLQDIIARQHRATSVQLVKKSVTQVLKEAAKSHSGLLASDYDLVYCAGLFDYLPGPICQKLVSAFYHMLAPGGLVLVTNVDETNPARNWMEYSVDWHLIYRNRARMSELCPLGVPEDNCRIQSEESGVNIFMEVRKPNG
jgi:extracellular factor (EF) 3-hydroxypalmitic acid methyl ester biosynthesis protein